MKHVLNSLCSFGAADLVSTLSILSGSALTLSTAQAADVSWATYGADTSGVFAPGIVGAPDGTMATFPWEAAKFTDRRSYASLSATMGLTEPQLVSFDVLAWEGNGGAPAAAGGWESARWVFSEGSGSSISSTFNGVTGSSSNPAVLFKTGSISGAAYNSLFGTSVPGGEVWSWLLVSLPSSFNARSPSFRVDFLPVGGGIGLGEGTPDPDAIGVLSAVPEPSNIVLMALGLGVMAAVRRRLNRAGAWPGARCK